MNSFLFLFFSMKFLQNKAAESLGCMIKFEDLKATENRVLSQVVLIDLLYESNPYCLNRWRREIALPEDDWNPLPSICAALVRKQNIRW